MKELWTKLVASIKSFLGKLNKTAKILLATAAGVVLIAAVAITVYLNAAPSGYVELYPGITETEATQVYAEIQEQGVEPKLEKGKVMVPVGEKDGLILKLSEKGYPTTAPLYNFFQENTGFTRTEMEKKQVILYQLQERLQETIKLIDGVDYNVVTINVPEDSNRVWETSKEEASASVTIAMLEDYELSPERVIGIRNMIASAVPKLKAENVTVIDALTGIDMGMEEETVNGVDSKRLEFERSIEKQIENKIKTLLTPMYGPSGVTAVATVKLNYDNVKTQEREVVPQDDGNGVKKHQEELFDTTGDVAVGDVVGEENNTDTPAYANIVGDANGAEVKHYEKKTDWDISTRLVETESGPAYIEEASASVLVKAKDGDFTAEMQERLTNMVAMGVNIPVESISVEYYPDTALEASAEPEPQTPQSFLEFFLKNWLIFAIGGGVLLLLIIALVVVLLIRSRAKKKVIAAQEEAEDLVRSAQAEIDEHKRALAEAAQASSTKENAITNEVREFAKQNPEITASLIRSMLKEDE